MKNHLFSTVVTIILAGFSFSSQAASTKSIHSLPPIPCPNCGFKNLEITQSETPKLEFKNFRWNDIDFIKIDLIEFLNIEFGNQCRETNNSNFAEPSTALDNQRNNNGYLQPPTDGPGPMHRVSGGTRGGYPPNCLRDGGRNNNRVLPPVESQAAPIPRVGGGTR